MFEPQEFASEDSWKAMLGGYCPVVSLESKLNVEKKLKQKGFGKIK